LLSGFVDDSNFSNPNALVGADAVITSGRTIVGDKVLRALFLRAL